MDNGAKAKHEFVDNFMDSLPEGVAQRLKENTAEHDRRLSLRAASELAKRQVEPLRLYQPTEIQDKYHSCQSKVCLFQAGNQVGKSLAGFAEIARAVLGMDPYEKYPKKDGICAILGYKERHIGMVVHRYLFKPGAFKMIRDAESGDWRVWRPWVPQDAARKSEALDVPPLIPKRYIENITWKDKAKNVFSQVYLTTGWVIHAFSSTSKPDQGFQLDLGHIDEDIINEDWYGELVARTSMRNGYVRWTALPHNENDALNRVAERAEDEEADYAKGGPKPTVTLVRATVYDNPYMSDEAREANIKLWKDRGEDEYRKRALGERITDTVRMYPTFNRHVHAVQNYSGQLGGLFDEYLRTNVIPNDWCCDMIIDPGHATCAGLFIATVQTSWGEFHLAFDEMYLHQCNANDFGRSAAEKTKGRWWQRFIIDSHGGNLTSMDTGLTPQEAYERELSRQRVQCIDTGSNFARGCDAIQFRETQLREWLSLKDCGVPTLLYDAERCPNLEREMIRFKKMRMNGEIIDKGNRRANTHLVECAEYAAAHGLEYKAPPRSRRDMTPAQRWLQSFRQRQKARAARNGGMGAGQHIFLGPQGAAE